MWRGVSVASALFALAVSGSAGFALAYDVEEVVNGASISGSITFHGTAPEPKVFQVEKDPEVCGQERALVEVAARNGLLKGAVVVLEGVERGRPFEAQTFHADPPGEGEFRYRAGENLALEATTKKCSFGPLTGVLTPDEPVRFLNQDPMKHTIQTLALWGRKGSILRTIHNRDIRPDVAIERTFTGKQLKSSRIVRFRCNRHDFMQNWLYVVESPYFAISDENGQFSIDEVPAGEYELVAWHPVLGLQKQEVTVTAGGNLQANFTFSEQE